MDVNDANVVAVLGFLLSFALGLFNWYNGSQRNKSMGMLERGSYLKTINESVDLANKRALDAEKRAISAEIRADALEKRISDLEGLLSYKLTFDVLLGANPKVEHVTIEHYPERRNADVRVQHDNRNK